MHIEPTSDSNPRQPFIQRGLVSIFGSETSSAAARLLSNSSISQAESLATAALLRPLCGSVLELVNVLKTFGESTTQRMLDFCSYKATVVNDRGETIVSCYDGKNENKRVNRLYYIALKRFVSAARTIGLGISVEDADVFDPLLQPAAGVTPEIGTGAGIADSLRLLLVSSAIKKQPELIREIVSNPRFTCKRGDLIRGSIQPLLNQIFITLGAGESDQGEILTAARLVFENRFAHPRSFVKMRLTVGESGAVRASLSGRVVEDIEGLVDCLLETLKFHRTPGKLGCNGLVLFARMPCGRSLLDHLSIDQSPVVAKHAVSCYPLNYLLVSLSHCFFSGRRLSQLVRLAHVIRKKIGLDRPLSLNTLQYAADKYGTRDTALVFEFAAHLNSRNPGFYNHLWPGNYEMSEHSFAEWLLSAVFQAKGILGDLNVEQISSDYLRLGHLAVQILVDRISVPDTTKILRMAKGDTLSHLLLCVRAMTMVWKTEGVPSTPSALLEQVKRDGYRGMLVLWAGDRRLVAQSYSAIGRNFNAEYRADIRRFEQSGRDPSYWLGELKTGFVAAFTAAFVQGRFSRGALAGVARRFLTDSVKVDSPPYTREPDGTTAPGYDRCYHESVETIFKSASIYNGQGALMYLARRSAQNRDSALVDFAKHCSKTPLIIEGARDSYPGAGVVMRSLKIENLVPRAALGGDLATTLPLLSRTHAYLRDSQLCYLRGCRIVIPPDSVDFHVSGEPMALIAFQDHFGDPEHLGVVLVSRTAAERLRDRLVTGKRFNNSRDVLDFCRSGYKPVLHISSISCLGGLCNSFDVGSPPLWGWENLASFARSTRDFWGHVHKYYGVGATQRGEQSGTTLKLLEEFAKAHDEVYAVCTRLFDLELAWRFAMQRYQLGHFYGTPAGEDIYSDSPARFEGDLDFPRFGFRALQSAIHWHMDLRAAENYEKNNYPVYVLANPFDHWSRPATNVYLDTFNMMLYDNGEQQEILVPGDSGADYEDFVRSLRPIDRGAWKYRIWGPAEVSGFELRPEHRRRLGLS